MIALILCFGLLGHGLALNKNPDTEVEMPLISNDDVPLVAKLDTKNLNKAIKTYINKTLERVVMEKFSKLKSDISSKIMTDTYPRDCEDITESKSGIYRIYPSDIRGFETYCEKNIEEGGWLVFQRRQDGSVDFYRNWTDYKNGFGDLTGEFWLGNSKIHEITTKDEYELYILMEDLEGEQRYARYKTFYVGDVQSKFTLQVGGYSGNAGNSLDTGAHNGQPFSTLDRDSSSNCPKQYKGAWWYKNCHNSNLNGLYLNGSHKSFADGIEWQHWKGYNYSLKKTQMMIRRRR
ncbi:Angiopoietin-related protein 1,Ficolin-1-A,Angiopoietin-1,Fibrinogen C domain-containing protein 1,Ryncolin-1,Tenascin-N,Angiopoietin-related protein 7,Angiopoietin-related protein 6,Ficolin-3,Fibrinogen C domain-containing protein 1-B,Fibroleukin,Fibrinogen-like protein 1,Ficolin-1,Ficolin-1-B,Angiopoietin-4,Tenascin-R,Ryncolin-2,Techylectin-5B,Fibrinogen C domain-containing protein 1-A,Microfibril-associated glycoprotein 4,Fibrinogen-like protein A,Ryncolin-3,Fibrinogen gamma chain,Tenascin-X,Ficolin-2,T|uniref:Fibrinogen C-terminal domain-containing protein n=1 Tax=Mytilus edulis TaxID=6550 RepID=A0A8S3QC92_MYTED|nr:Angiopoietin-related protein 1,Ficolin-1-A,Angiopoietin-1,Fibrinogen C domain-containing protein 1,Ryncolin-1,Tenascin-N,Angiopoietin-related protein 7,Angiopoietin-related protein 6,Ficolin-3,Fibrinogen C domain-containing protein 1-B,Fibroleukin,Fibrinogen-like protein 1,Ficolin-1,Ficolin-1-B,Angiopoietin-4,Tenascin-R,Ryncolin-2,Techylectin-5B,Fibrinogen C domain-containing protein 1-A,Microfibril-associated glycoprotein 4,Fibrinogen-like protein A,Ryncolin-3,Fibrinogen gamma chain,Tenascin-X,